MDTIKKGKATRRSHQSILKEINPEYSLEGFDVDSFLPSGKTIIFTH